MQRMVLSLRKFLGLNNLLPDHDLVKKLEFIGRTAHCDTFLLEAENVDITDEFHIRRRNGFDNKVVGNIHSLWSDGKICLYREGVYLKRLYTNYTPEILRNNLTDKRIPMVFLSLIDKVYYSDGIDTGVIENGISRSWGLDSPIHPVITRISGVMRGGNYKVALVYIRSNGMMSGSAIPTLTNVINNSALVLTNIPVSNDPTVAYIDIYITNPNGDALYLFHSIANGVTTYTINSNVVQAGLPLNTVGLSKPPVGDMIEYYNGKIYVINGSIAWHSESYAYELFRLRSNYIQMENPYTLFSAVKDGIWVSDGKRIYFMQGDNPPFKLLDKADYGAIKGTAQKISGDYIGEGVSNPVIVWASPSGICVGGDGGSFKNLTDKNYSFPITENGISFFKQARGINQYIIALKNASDAENINEDSIYINMEGEVDITLPNFNLNVLG
jgi:hypothetical protein